MSSETLASSIKVFKFSECIYSFRKCQLVKQRMFWIREFKVNLLCTKNTTSVYNTSSKRFIVILITFLGITDKNVVLDRSELVQNRIFL